LASPNTADIIGLYVHLICDQSHKIYDRESVAPVSISGIVRHKKHHLPKGYTVNISIKSEINGNAISNDYRKMSARSIVDEINLLISEGHKIIRVIDLDEIDPFAQ
jgi:hypothetical protein